MQKRDDETKETSGCIEVTRIFRTQKTEHISSYNRPNYWFSGLYFTKLHRLHSFTFTDHYSFVAPILNFGPDLMKEPLPIASGLSPNSGGLCMLSFFMVPHLCYFSSVLLNLASER